MVQAHRTSSNLFEPHHYRDSKVCRVLSHEFGVVRPYRTFSIYIVAGETRSAGCLCTSSGWFKRIEPPRTTEPSLTISLQGKQGVQGVYALGSSASNLLEVRRVSLYGNFTTRPALNEILFRAHPSARGIRYC